MTQAPSALPTPAVLDYERTLILAIELSNTSWVLAAQIPGLPGGLKPSAPSSRLLKR
jgi:transposase